VLDLNALVRATEKLCRRLLGEDVEFVCRTVDSPARIRANPGHIEQVLLNLVVNARDAMPQGGRLTIETANVLLTDTSIVRALPIAPGAYVRVSVTDTGVGMDRATRERIFEPFFTTKERGKGTGLGLSTVFGIVQQSAGTIEVLSENGRGTTFNVYFPREDAAVDAPATTLPPPTLRGTETILLVEDDDGVRAIARTILRRNGYSILEAGTPEQAISLCAKHSEIRLIVTDVIMPKMSGPELSRHLRRHRPGARVLFMSGYTDDSLTRYPLEAGEAFLQKPFTPDSLLRKVREVLEGLSR
jgi:CheY-like chemotaxis protein